LENLPNALSGFIQLIEQMQDETKHLDLPEKVAHLIKASGLMAHYAKDKTDKAGSKTTNLEELIAAAKEHTHEEGSDMSETLSVKNT
jgi:DNA helicase-2/ATP-dependent DNA helicase PcrA